MNKWQNFSYISLFICIFLPSAEVNRALAAPWCCCSLGLVDMKQTSNIKDRQLKTDKRTCSWNTGQPIFEPHSIIVSVLRLHEVREGDCRSLHFVRLAFQGCVRCMTVVDCVCLLICFNVKLQNSICSHRSIHMIQTCLSQQRRMGLIMNLQAKHLT